MRKRILSLLLIGVLAITITGCGNNNLSKDKSNSSNNENKNTKESITTKHILTCRGTLYSSLTKEFIYYFDNSDTTVKDFKLNYIYNHETTEEYEKHLNNMDTINSICETAKENGYECNIKNSKKDKTITIALNIGTKNQDAIDYYKLDMTKEELKQEFETQSEKNKNSKNGYQNVTCEEE